MTETTGGVAADRLRTIVERIERLDGEIADLQAGRREILAEAKGAGFDATALCEILRLRRLEDHERAERSDLVRLYAGALGMEV